MQQHFCTHCGNKLPPDSIFCSYCGAPLNKQTHQANHEVTNSHVPPTKPFLKKYRWVLTGLAAFIVIFVIIQIQNDKPETVAKDFVKYLSNAEINKAADLIAINADEDFRDQFREITAYYHENKAEARETIRRDIKSFQILEVEEYTKDYIGIYGEVILKDNDREDVYIDLVKENKKWKVADSY